MKLYCDGFTEYSNPSQIGGGYAVLSEDKSIFVVEYVKKTNFTNNEAELLGIQKAIQLAQENDEIITDSMNNLLWIKSCKTKVRKDLIPIMIECNKLSKEKNLKLIQKPREENLAGIYIEEILEKDWEKKYK